MPQLLDRSQVSTTITVPLDLIEAETLSLLGVEIIDIQDNIDDCIPQGDIRYWVQRGETELLGGISNWGNRIPSSLTHYSPLDPSIKYESTVSIQILPNRPTTTEFSSVIRLRSGG